jgi:hypothetical protein
LEKEREAERSGEELSNYWYDKARRAAFSMISRASLSRRKAEEEKERDATSSSYTSPVEYNRQQGS